MPVLADIKLALQQALKAQDKIKIGTLRLVLAAIKDREIAARTQGAGDELSDAILFDLLGKMIRQRQESAKAYADADRPELAAQERAEIGVIEHFLPPQMTESDIVNAVRAVIQEVNATSLRDMGQVMQALKTRYAGKMDFTRASCLVKKSLA